jgi:hypothetical protein
MTHRDEVIAPTATLVIERLDAAQQLIEIGWCQTASSIINERGPRYYCA